MAEMAFSNFEPMQHSLTITRKGIADEQLAKAQAERGRKRGFDENTLPRHRSKRSRSSSSSFSSSVSTISTNRSRSVSSKRSKKSHHFERDTRIERGHSSRKRRRSLSTSSSGSYSSYSSSSRSPPPRRDRYEERNTRRRHSSNSPQARGRDRHSGGGRRVPRRSRSRTDSMDRSRIARNRNSLTPDVRSNHERGTKHRSPWLHRDRRYSNTDDDDRYGGGRRRSGPRDDFRRESPAQKRAPPTPEVRQERSLSPFSKRLALTKAMNMGR